MENNYRHEQVETCIIKEAIATRQIHSRDLRSNFSFFTGELCDLVQIT